MDREQLAWDGLESILQIRQSGRGGTCVYLVRDRETLARRREMYYQLAEQRGFSPGDVPIQMWGGWINRLTRTVGLSARRLDWSEQLMAIRLCMATLSPGEGSQLAGVWNARGMSGSVAKFISEARENGLSAGKLQDRLPPEIHSVMTRWENLLRDNDWTDLLRRFKLLRDEVSRQGLQLRRMVVEDCSHLRPPEIELLAAVADQCGSVDIYLPHDPQRLDLFAAPEDFVRRLGSLRQHVTTYRPAADTRSLAWRIFRPVPPAEEIPDNARPATSIWTVADEKQQAGTIAAYLKRQLASGRYQPGDCCVVVRDEEHRQTVARQLNRSQIPHTAPIRVPVGDTEIGQTVQAVVEVIARPSAENIARLTDSPYFCPPGSNLDDGKGSLTHLTRMVQPGCTQEEILQRLQEVIDSLRYRKSGDGSLGWGSEDSLSGQLREAEAMKEKVSRLLSLLSAGTDCQQPGWSEMLQHLHSCIVQLGVPRRLQRLLREDGGYSWGLLRDARAYEVLRKQLLWKLDEVGRRVLPVEESIESWEMLRRVIGDLVSNFRIELPGSIQKLPANPPDGRGVQLATPAQAASGRYPLMVMPYMADGIFPRSRAENWLENRLFEEISAKDQGEFGDWGDPGAEDRREANLFFRCVHAAGQQLILLRPLQLGDDPKAASPYLGEVEAVWSVQRTDYTLAANRGPDVRHITCFADLRHTLVRQFGFSLGQREEAELLQDSFSGRHLVGMDPGVAPEDRDTLSGSADDMLRRLRAEQQRWSSGYGQWDGMLHGAQAAGYLQDVFSDDAVLSVTALNRYAGCPFRSFCEHVLQLESPFTIDREISALFVGQIYHQVLEEYYRKRRGQIALKEYCPSERRRALRRLLHKYCQQLYRGMSWLPESAFASLRRRGYETLTMLLEAEFEKMSASCGEMHLFADQFEIRFKRSMDQLGAAVVPPYSAGTSAILRGKIDRVDRTDDPESTAADRAVVLDYKLSSEPPGLQEIRAGEDLQMPLYVLAARLELDDLQVEGGSYISMNKATWERGLYTQRGARLLALDQSRSKIEPLTEEEFEDVLRGALRFASEYLEAMRRGEFPVSPADSRTCRYCDYTGVCRGVDERLRGKNTSDPVRGGESGDR